LSSKTGYEPIQPGYLEVCTKTGWWLRNGDPTIQIQIQSHGYLVGDFEPFEKYESQWEGLSHI
jgi:hypothetical protein